MPKARTKNHISLALAMREIIDNAKTITTARKIARKALRGLNHLDLTYTIPRKEYMKLEDMRNAG